MNYKKRIINPENKFSFVIREYINNKGSDNFSLIITGWQSLSDIYLDIISNSEKNFIIFDYPGVGDNKFLSCDITSDFSIIKDVLSCIDKMYIIDRTISSSAGTAIILSNIDIFANKKNILIAPQVINNNIDHFLAILFKLFIIIEEKLHVNIYNRFLGISSINNIWIKSVANDSYNPKTIDMVKIGIKNAHPLHTPKQFIELYKLKSNYKRTIRIIKENIENIFFVICINDINSNTNKLERDIFDNQVMDHVFYINSNHVAETEAYNEIIHIVNNH